MAIFFGGKPYSTPKISIFSLFMGVLDGILTKNLVLFNHFTENMTIKLMVTKKFR